MTDERTTDGRKTDGRKTDGQTTDGQTTDGQTTDGQTTDGQTTDGQTTDGRKVVIAIDGPAGSGKSSVSRAAAKVLGFSYQDTGAAYRGFALYCLQHATDLADPDAVTAALKDFDYEIGIDPDNYWVHIGGVDVTDEIRQPWVSAAVSSVAGLPVVRQFMVDLFRSIIQTSLWPGIVVEGRDITTVVAPDAQVRILLTASEQVRIGRRSAELTGESAESTARQLSSRDAQDSKVVDFLNAAEGVTTLDSTNLDFDQTVAAVVALVRDAGAPHT